MHVVGAGCLCVGEELGRNKPFQTRPGTIILAAVTLSPWVRSKVRGVDAKEKDLLGCGVPALSPLPKASVAPAPAGRWRVRMAAFQHLFLGQSMNHCGGGGGMCRRPLHPLLHLLHPRCSSEDAPHSIDSTPEGLPGSGFSARGEETPSLQGRLGAAQWAAGLLFPRGSLCLFLPRELGSRCQEEWKGGRLPPQLLPISPSLRSGLPMEGRADGGGGAESCDTPPAACPAPSHCLSSLHGRKTAQAEQGPLSPTRPCCCLIGPRPPPPDLIKGSLLMLPSRPPSIFGHG